MQGRRRAREWRWRGSAGLPDLSGEQLLEQDWQEAHAHLEMVKAEVKRFGQEEERRTNQALAQGLAAAASRAAEQASRLQIEVERLKSEARHRRRCRSRSPSTSSSQGSDKSRGRSRSRRRRRSPTPPGQSLIPPISVVPDTRQVVADSTSSLGSQNAQVTPAWNQLGRGKGGWR